jgi:hypothetical protein
LFLDEVTREHEDLEVAIFREHQDELRKHYAGWGQHKSVGGWVPWEEAERLELPIHQILFRPPGSGPPPDPWQPVPEERQFFLEDVEDDTWICRRDRRLRRPVEELTVHARGVPVVVPEIQLLYKAKHTGEKDESDFRATLPRLDDAQRSWLMEALELVHPGHRWLEALV